MLRPSLMSAVLGSLLVFASACSVGSADDAVAASDLTAAAAASGSPSAQLEAARAKLRERLAAAGSSYQYEVRFVSYDGAGTTTKIVVSHGEPVQRVLESFITEPGGRTKLTDYASELGPELGTHPGFAPARPIEALYDQCERDVLTQPATMSPTLRLDGDGLLQSCTFVDPSCADDCAEGVSVARLDTFDLAQPTALLERKISAASGDYAYTVRGGSWTGASFSTSVVFRGNAPFRREYRATSEGQPTVEWVEEGAAIGSHPEGEPAKALGALYAQCRDEVLQQDLTQNRLTLAFDEGGILRSCTLFPEGCADDCSEGVSLAEVKIGR